MPARTRKFIGLGGMLAFLAAYIFAVTKIAEHVPQNLAIEVVLYVIVGVGWGVPIMPLISWMNRGR